MSRVYSKNDKELSGMPSIILIKKKPLMKF